MSLRNRFAAPLAAAAVVVLAAFAAGCCRPQQCPAPPPPPQCPACQCAQAAQPGYTGPTREEWMHLNFRIMFPTGGATLDTEARAVLEEAVRTLRDRTDILRIRAEGHTDTRGPDISNDQLSLQRAQAVVDYLAGLGVPSAMLEAQGYGATQPITSDTSDMDREQNRRVEFSILVRRPVGATGPLP